MNAQTVTIVTTDHGPVTIPEPAWCTGITHEADGARSDICHFGEAVPITVASPSGPVELLSMHLVQWPYGLTAPSNDVHVNVHFLNRDAEYDWPGLDALAEDLVKAAGHVRAMARRLAVEERRGDPMTEPRSEPTPGAAAKDTPRGESTLSSDVLDLLAAIRDALDVPAPAPGAPGGYDEMRRVTTSRAAAVCLAAKVAVKMGTPHWGVLAESVREATESIPVDYDVRPDPAPDADGGR